jgi:hypothetical protein
MSVITDKARDFWDRISARERNLVILAAVATPIVLALWLGTAIHDGLSAMEKHNNRTRSALLAVEAMRAKGEVKAPVDDVVAVMGIEPLPLDTYIGDAAKKAKFDLNGSISPRAALTKNGFVTNTSSLTLQKRNIEEVKDFLTALETGSKVVMVTSLKLKPDFHDKDKLTVDVDVSTYSREPPKAGSGAGSAGGSDSKSKAGN